MHRGGPDMFSTVIKSSLFIGAFAIVLTQFLARSPAINGAGVPLPAAVASAQRQSELYADRSGHYHTNAEIDHQLIAVMVDTGASIIALTYEDALKLNVVPKPSEFRIAMSTANGTAYGARVQLKSVKLGQVEVQFADAVIMPRGALNESLLGMSFLNRISSFEVSKGRLVLKQ